MANELTAIARTGLTLTATLSKSGIVVASSIAMTETSVSGYYIGSMPALALGSYAVLVISAGIIVASGMIDWDGTREINHAGNINELHLIHGLQPASPLVVNLTNRVAGVINQSLAGDATQTTVTRL